MNGSATSRSKNKMTIDTFRTDDVPRNNNGSGTSSHSAEDGKPTGIPHHELFVKTVAPQTATSKTNREAARSRTNGVSKTSKVRKVEKRKLEKYQSVERSHVHLVYSQMAPHLHGIQQKAWPRVKQFLKSLQPGSIVADIGCGSGRYLHINKSLYKLGSDICIPLVQYAKEKGHEVMVADNLTLPYRHDVFDAVVSVGVIHHFSSYERRVQALKELTRVLSPGGKLLVCVWAFEQKHRRFESQDVLIPWYKPPQSDLQRVRGSCSDFERSSTSSVSDDDASSISSSVSIDSLQDASRSYSLQETSFRSRSLPQVDINSKSLVQECRKVEACLKKMSMKPEDYPYPTDKQKNEVAANVYSNGMGSTSSRSHLKVGQIRQDDAMSTTSWSVDDHPWNRRSGCGDGKEVAGGACYSVGYKTAVGGRFQQCSESEEKKTSDNALNKTPNFLPCRPSDIGLLCAHTSTQKVFKLESEMFSSSWFKRASKHNEKVKPGMLHKFKVAFLKLFSSHHHARDPMDQIFSYGRFPQGFQVREFPQSSLGVTSQSHSDSNLTNQSHQKQQVISKDHRASTIPSCTEVQGERKSENYTNGFPHRGEQQTSHHHEQNVLFKKQISYDKDLDDEDVFGDTAAVKNGIKTNHKQSFACQSSAEILESFESEEDLENLDHLEVSFTNSQLSRYYHVFREGELQQLVSENIDDLVILDTYFDHSNWCLVAEKVSNV